MLNQHVQTELQIFSKPAYPQAGFLILRDNNSPFSSWSGQKLEMSFAYIVSHAAFNTSRNSTGSTFRKRYIQILATYITSVITTQVFNTTISPSERQQPLQVFILPLSCHLWPTMQWSQQSNVSTFHSEYKPMFLRWSLRCHVLWLVIFLAFPATYHSTRITQFNTIDFFL